MDGMVDNYVLETETGKEVTAPHFLVFRTSCLWAELSRKGSSFGPLALNLLINEYIKKESSLWG